MAALIGNDFFVVRNCLREKDGPVGRWCFYWCPSCNTIHGLPIDYANNKGAMWRWNGDAEKPTMSPSIQISRILPDHRHYVCHHYLELGKLKFLPDTTPNHEYESFANRTVDLPELPRYWRRVGENF